MGHVLSVSGGPLSDLDEAVLRGFMRGRSVVVALGLVGDDERAALRDALTALAPTVALPAHTPVEVVDLLPTLPADALVLLLGRSRVAYARRLIRTAPVPLTLLWRGYVDRDRDHRIETLRVPDRLVQRWAVFDVPAT